MSDGTLTFRATSGQVAGPASKEGEYASLAQPRKRGILPQVTEAIKICHTSS